MNGNGPPGGNPNPAYSLYNYMGSSDHMMSPMYTAYPPDQFMPPGYQPNLMYPPGAQEMVDALSGYAPGGMPSMAAAAYLQRPGINAPAHRFPPARASPSAPPSQASSAPPTQRTLTTIWQRPTPEQNAGVPDDHFLVTYESLKSSEIELALAVDVSDQPIAVNEEAPAGVPETEEPWVGSRSRSFNIACDVCSEWRLLPEMSHLPPAKIYASGRKPFQSHQCVGCGIVVHRVCYGVTACLLKEPLFNKSIPPAQAKVSGRKAIPAPKIPLLNALWERTVAPQTKTPYCRFICDVCLYLSQMQHRGTSVPPDLMNNLPLYGRCVLCAGTRGPRKLILLTKAERSTLPDYVFAHAFCLLNASPQVVRIRDWKTLSGIRVDENALIRRRNQLITVLKCQFACEICHEGSNPQMGSVGSALETCRHFAPDGVSKEEQPADHPKCARLYHPLCLRTAALEYEQRTSGYRLAYQPVLSLRTQPSMVKQLTFGSFSCFEHIYQDFSKTARVCCICDESSVDPVYPNNWTSCRNCNGDLHVSCTEREGAPFKLWADLCRSCRGVTEALSVLESEWQSASLIETRSVYTGTDCHLQHCVPIGLPSRVVIARQRLAEERLNKSFANSLQPPTLTAAEPPFKSLYADALITVVASKFFATEVTQAQWRIPVPCTLQSYILLKGIYSKRQQEWLLATQPVALPDTSAFHPLLASKDDRLTPLHSIITASNGVQPISSQPTITETPTSSSEPPATPATPSQSAEPVATGMKKRFTMKKQTKSSDQSTTTPSLDLDAGVDTETASSIGGKDETAGSTISATNSSSKQAGSRLMTSMSKNRSKLIKPKQQAKKRPSGTEVRGQEKKKRKTDVGAEIVWTLSASTLKNGSSLFSLLLLQSLGPMLPVTSPEEQDAHNRLRSLAAGTSQLFAELLEVMAGLSNGMRQTFLELSVKIELIRRLGLLGLSQIVGPAYVSPTATFPVYFSGAKWIQLLLKTASSSSGYEAAWLSAADNEALTALNNADISCILALSGSFELESCRWIIMYWLAQDVINSRMEGMIEQVAEQVPEDKMTPSYELLNKICQNFSLTELRALAELLNQSSRRLLMNAHLATAESLDAHFARYCHLFKIVRGCVLNEVTVFESPDKGRELPFPFFIYLASYHATDPSRFLTALPPTLLPPPLLFHARPHPSDPKADHVIVGGALGAVLDTVAELERLTQAASEALSASMVDLDVMRSLIQGIIALDLPSGHEDLISSAKEMKHLVLMGEELEKYGSEIKSEWRMLRLFVRAFIQSEQNEKSVQESEASLQWPASLLPCLTTRFTSKHLNQFPKLVADVEEWRRSYAKLRAMLAPTTNASAAASKKRGKLRLTAGGAVKVSGETGFLRPSSGASSSGTEGRTPSDSQADAGKRLTFTNQIPIGQAMAVYETGRNLGVDLPELQELKEWVDTCCRYELKLKESSQFFVNSILLTVYTGSETFGFRFQHSTAGELTARLMGYRRPCAACVSQMVALPLELNSDYASLPFSIENTDQFVVNKCLDALKSFLSALKRFTKTTCVGDLPPSCHQDIEKELLEYSHFSIEQEMQEWKRKKAKSNTSISTPQAAIDFNAWVAQAADLFEVLQARMLDCVLPRSTPSDSDTMLTNEQLKELGGDDVLEEVQEFCCESCAESVERDFRSRPVFRRSLMILSPFLTTVTRIYDQVILKQFPLNTIALHVVHKISADRQFHPTNSRGLTPLQSEQAMVGAFRGLAAEAHHIHGHGAVFTNAWNDLPHTHAYLIRLETFVIGADESVPLLDVWKACAISLLIRLRTAILVLLRTVADAKNLAFSQWKSAIFGGLTSLMEKERGSSLPDVPAEWTEETQSLSSATSRRGSEVPKQEEIAFFVPWNEDTVKGLLLRSLSLLGLFQHFAHREKGNFDSTESDYSVVTMHYGLTRLLKSIKESDLETTFDRSIFTIVKQATWERRAREALRLTQASINHNAFSLQPLLSIVAEIQSGAESSLSTGALEMYKEASRILMEAFMRASAIEYVVQWLQALPPRSEMVATPTLFSNLMSQELRSHLAQSGNSSEEQIAELLNHFVDELNGNCGARLDSVQAMRDAPQTSLLWRICRGTCRLLLTPAASANFFEVPAEMIQVWLKGVSTWSPSTSPSSTEADRGVWSVVAGGSIPGQIVAIDTMRLASAGLTQRSFCQSVINDTSRLANSGVFSVFDALTACQNDGMQDASLHYLMGTFLSASSELSWLQALRSVPWPGIVFGAYLQGVSAYDVEEAWDLPSLNGFEEDTANGPLVQLKGEMDAFLIVCEGRRQVLSSLVNLTVPRCNLPTPSQDMDLDSCFDQSLGGDKGPAEEEDLPAKLRSVLLLAMQHIHWLEECVTTLGPSLSEEGRLVMRRDISSVLRVREAFASLKTSVMEMLGSVQVPGSHKTLMCNLLFGHLAGEWVQRFQNQQLTDAVVDMFLGGVLGLELRRVVACLSTTPVSTTPTPNQDTGVTVKCQLSRLTSLIEVLTPTQLSETVTNWALANSLRNNAPPDGTGGNSMEVNLKDINNRLVFLPEGTSIMVPNVTGLYLPFAEIFWLEEVLAKLVSSLLEAPDELPEKDEEKHPNFVATVSKQIKTLLTDTNTPLHVIGGKLFWSLLVDDEITLFGVMMEFTRNGERSMKLKFLSPVLLIALIECAPVWSLAKSFQKFSDQVRDVLKTLMTTQVRLPKSLNILIRFLALRLSISADLRSPAVSYNLAVDVLKRVDILVSRCFPTELVETCRQLFNLSSLSPELSDILHLMKNAYRGGLNFSKLQSGNTMLVTHPSKLCFLELAPFSQSRQMFQPIIDRCQAILSGVERCNLLSALQTLQNIDQLVQQVGVTHPLFEQFKMFVEENLSVLRTYQDLAQAWRASVATCVASGRAIFEDFWNNQQATLSLLPIRRQPSHHSNELLLHCLNWHDLGTLMSPGRPRLSAMNARRRSTSLSLLRDEGTSPVIQVIDQLTETLLTAERQCEDALKDIATALNGIKSSSLAIDAGQGGDGQTGGMAKGVKLPLSMLVRLYLFPRFPPDLHSWLMPANAPDLTHLLGVPCPFGLFDVISSPDLEVGKAISGWTIYVLHEVLKCIECHEVLFGGSDAPVASTEALKLGLVVGSHYAGPAWTTGAESLLEKMLHLIPICCDVSCLGFTSGQQRLLSITQIRLVQFLKDRGDPNGRRMEAIVQVLTRFPGAVEAVHGFVAQTGLSRILFRCLWEMVVNFLPCKGDPFNMGNTQPVFKEAQTSSLIFAPSSATTHKLFAIGKSLLREPLNVPVEGENLENVPPALHPALRAYHTRSHLANILPNYIPWPKRAERLYESLKSTLQYGKILIGEAQASVEAFTARLSLYGLCPVLNLTKDLRSFKQRIEARSGGLRIDAGDAFSAKQEDPDDIKPNSASDAEYGTVTEAEMHRLDWLGAAVGPSVILPQVSKKGTPYMSTSASPQLVQWVEGTCFPETRDLLISKCRATPPLNEAHSSIFELVVKFACLVTGTLPCEEVVDETTSEDISALVHSFPPKFSRKRFLKSAVSSDELLLGLLGAHMLVSPFDLNVLRHSALVMQQHPSFDRKMVFAPMLVVNRFLGFANPQTPESDDSLRQPSDALNRQLLQALNAHVFSRVNPAESSLGGSNGGGLFNTSPDLQTDSLRSRPLGSLPPPKCLTTLLPELQRYSATFMDAHQKKRFLDRRISGEVAWWGSAMSSGKDFQSSYVSHILVKSIAELDSVSIQTLLSLVTNFVKFEPSASLTEADLMVPLSEVAARQSGAPLSDAGESQTTRDGTPLSSDGENDLFKSGKINYPCVGDSSMEEGEANDDDATQAEPHVEKIRCDSLHHFQTCNVFATDLTEICAPCRRFLFTENPRIHSDWSQVKVMSDFSKAQQLTVDNIKALSLMLNVVLPLRVPVVVLPEYPESFLQDIFAPLTTLNCKEKLTGGCCLAKSKLPTSYLTIAPRVLRFDGALSATGREVLPNLRVQLYLTVSATPLHHSCAAKSFKRTFSLQSSKQLAFFGQLMIYDTKVQLAGLPSLDSSSPSQQSSHSSPPPPPTLRTTFQNEPPANLCVIKDSACASVALNTVIQNLRESFREVQAKEPLLATRHNAETPLCDIPHFDRALARPPMASIIGKSCTELQRIGFGVTCLQCAVHKACVMLAVDPAGRLVAARAKSTEKQLE